MQAMRFQLIRLNGNKSVLMGISNVKTERRSRYIRLGIGGSARVTLFRSSLYSSLDGSREHVNPMCYAD